MVTKRRIGSGEVLISLGNASDKADALAKIVDAFSGLNRDELERVIEFARELKHRDRSSSVWFVAGAAGAGPKVGRPRLYFAFPERPVLRLEDEDGSGERTPDYSCLVVGSDPQFSAPPKTIENAGDESARPSTQVVRETNAPHDEQAWNLRRQLLAESIPVADAAKRIGRTEQTAINRARARELLGIRDGVRWMFPKWQFDAKQESGLIPGLTETLQAVDAPAFSVALWLRAVSPVLDGMRPIDVLKSGDIDRVLTTARSLGSQ